MVTQLFSHFNVDGVLVFNNEIELLMDVDHSVQSIYEAPELDTLQTTIGGFGVYMSSKTNDFYIVNLATSVIPIRFPTLDECVEWIKSGVADPGVIALGVAAVALTAWVLFRKK